MEEEELLENAGGDTIDIETDLYVALLRNDARIGTMTVAFSLALGTLAVIVFVLTLIIMGVCRRVQRNMNNQKRPLHFDDSCSATSSVKPLYNKI